MKKFFSIFLPSLLVVACFLYVFPLNSLAEVYLDSEGCWSIASGDVHQVYSTSSVNSFTSSYSYSSSTSWTSLVYGTDSTVFTQLPSPFFNSRNIKVTFPKYTSFPSSTREDFTFLGFDFNGSFRDYVSDLNLVSGDYLCFVQLFALQNPLSDIHYNFAHIVTGNSFEPLCSIDDRFLIYNPHNISGVTQSLGLDSTLWSVPSSTRYFLLAYFNISYDDLLNYSSFNDISALTVSLNFSSTSSYNSFVYCPLFYKCSLNGDIQTINYLSSIDNNLQIISDAVQTHVDPSFNQPDYSTINAYEQKLGDDTALISSSFDQWLLNGSEIAIGLSWVGSVLTLFVNRFPFLQGIYGLILFFAVANLLRGGIFRKEWDYVTEDNYTVKGHNSKGDYEITGTRTTRRE